MMKQALSCFAGMLLMVLSLACDAQDASPPAAPSVIEPAATLVPTSAATPASASLSSSATVPGPIPYKRDTSLESDVTRTTLGLLLCFGVLAAVLMVLRRRNGKNGFLQTLQAEPPFVVLYSRRLGTRASLHAVEFAGKRFLIAQSGDRLTRLASSVGTGTPSRADSETRD